MDFSKIELPPYITTTNAEILFDVEASTLRRRLAWGTLDGFKIDPTTEKSSWLVSTEALDKDYKRRIKK